jgi:hypothetical protein
MITLSGHPFGGRTVVITGRFFDLHRKPPPHELGHRLAG